MIGLWEAGGHSRFWESYLIIKKLGSGGDGTVYLVKHIVTEQLRAAKQIHTGKKDKQATAISESGVPTPVSSFVPIWTKSS